ncbi:hypothetical protein VP01_5845g1, partial [Puccinia sorghi]
MDLVKEEGIQLAAPRVNMPSSLEPRYLPLLVNKEKFNNKTLNQMSIEDHYLQEAFHYCEPGATWFKQKSSGNKLYLELKDAMLNQLK